MLIITIIVTVTITHMFITIISCRFITWGGARQSAPGPLHPLDRRGLRRRGPAALSGMIIIIIIIIIMTIIGVIVMIVI